MAKLFIFCIFLSFFLARANVSPLTALDKEIMRLETEVKYMADPIGGLLVRLANEILSHKDDVRINGELQAKMDLYEETRFKPLFRQIIEDIEDEFPQPYDDDFSEKKVVWNKKILDAKVGFEKVEERRRQRWLHYAEHPPNDQMSRIVEKAKKVGLNPETFASGIAKAYRLLSDDLHKGQMKPEVIHDPKKNFSTDSVIKSLRVILKEASIFEEHINEFEF